MQYLEIFIGNQLKIVGYSFILGLIFGAVYDIIRILQLLCGILPEDDEPEKRPGRIPARLRFVILLLYDAVTMLLFGAAFSVFVYWANDGEFRWFMAAGTVGGFALWHATAGRLVMFFSEKITALLRFLLRLFVLTPLLWLFRGVRRCAERLARQTFGRLVRTLRRRIAPRRTDRLQRRLKRDLQFDGEEGGHR